MEPEHDTTRKRVRRLSAAAALAVSVLAASPWADVAPANAGVAAGGPSRYTVLSGVSCPGAASCFAVGLAYDRRTLAEHWDGRTWGIVPTPNVGATSSLSSISCPSSRRCIAVGSRYDKARDRLVPLAEKWNGVSWSVAAAPLPTGALAGTLESVACTGPSDCTAAGNINNNTDATPETLVEHWDGLRWSVASTPNPPGATVSDLWAVSCTDGSACTAVGDSAVGSGSETTLIEHGDGPVWTVVPSPGVPGAQTSLQAVSCVSTFRCTAGGFTYRSGPDSFTAATLVERETGGGWSVVASPDPPDTSYDGFGGLSCIGAVRCVAVGSAQSPTDITTLVESGTGKAWTIVSSPNERGSLSAFGAISCHASRRCMAVGNYAPGNGTRLPLSEEWNGTSWLIVAVPNP